MGEVVDIILQHKSRASKAVNEELLLTAWHVGGYVSAKIKDEERGSKVVSQLSEYIRSQHPDIKGYSRRSIYNMVMFYEEYSSETFASTVEKYLSSEFVQSVPAQIETIGTWEIIHNPNSKVVEFDHFRMQAGPPNFVLSVYEWIEKTCEIGLIVKKGKYGGTYATMPLLINQVNITTMNNIVSQLFNYVINNEVVYQLCGELMEVSNDKEKENKVALLSYLSSAKRIEVYDKHNAFELDGCTELVDWSTDDDVLFILDGIRVIICIPKEEAIVNNLIAA